MRSWVKQIKNHPVATVLLALLAVVIVLIILSILGYIFNWDWTGLNATDFTSTPQNITRTISYQPGKTLWDWLQLLIIPAVLAVAGYVINLTISRSEQAATEQRAQSEREAAEKQAQTEHEIALDNQRETILKEYLDKMSELLLHENLRESNQEHEVRTIARVQTMTTLSRLDNTRKVTILQFLYEARLINKDKCVLALDGADLYKINLSHVNLRGADLSGVILRRATLGGANLSDTNLSKTDLWGADFTTAIGGFEDLSTISSSEILIFDSADGGVMANIRGANLSDAILYGSNVTTKQLAQAQSLKGATMPDGTIHP